MCKIKYILPFFLFLGLLSCETKQEETVRIVQDFDAKWQFQLGEHPEAKDTVADFSEWRTLNLPHDWSIEGKFSKDNPAKPEGGALPTGIGWYRKEFKIPEGWKNKNVSIEFDGVYRNSEVWVNGHYLGKRPYGYSSFQYDLTNYLQFGKKNLIAVKVDNSAQPNSRWYTGSGIYRNVRLVATEKLHIVHWGTFVTTPSVKEKQANIDLQLNITNEFEKSKKITVHTFILDQDKKKVAEVQTEMNLQVNDSTKTGQELVLEDPHLWSPSNPYNYSVITKIYDENKKLLDNYRTPLGIRYFHFDAKKGFFLNGEHLKIKGVCLHHDNGALGAVVNTSAIRRKLQLLKDMGANAIRTAHNPPSPELLQLCDEMGFLVQDEIFDVWKKKKVDEDYHTDFPEWHKKDLEDWIRRDRNHPSVFMWSIGNEIREQFDSTGIALTQELAGLVKALDTTRPVTSALTENDPEKNYIYQSGALDVLGFNYKHEAYPDLPNRFKNQKFIASETVSGEATRGHYDQPSEKTTFWPPAHQVDFDGNEDYTVSAYDNVAAYWGSTHEATWKMVKKLDFMAGMFVWTGFDYLGEPIPYPYPARSSYFGIVDLAGFPKDVYYMYQSEWSDKTVLHLLPHWNWKKNDTISVWAYYNHADEVELFLNNKSLGKKSKQGDDLHISWKVPFQPGTLKAVSYKNGKKVKETSVQTSGKPYQIQLKSDKKTVKSDKKELVYVTVSVKDKNGVTVPTADNLIQFKVTGGKIVGVDNGYQASLASFKANYRKAFNGKCLVILQPAQNKKSIQLKAESEGLQTESLEIKTE